MVRLHTLSEFRERAIRRLPAGISDFVNGGAADERTLRDNEAAFDQWRLLPRVGVNVLRRKTSANILGYSAALPLILSPVGLMGLFWRQGEMAAARAAERMQIPYCLSTNSVATIEDVASAAPDADRWFQLYVLKDRVLTTELVHRAKEAGYRVLCVTVDLPVAGRRERDLRNGFTIPPRLGLGQLLEFIRHPGWLLDILRFPASFGNFADAKTSSFTSIARRVADLFDPASDWNDIAHLRSIWDGPFVIKGILHPRDARIAVQIGADAIVVSNHGGRQLDHIPASLAALPEIALAIGDSAPIILDGGIRRATDILIALALGATACGIGRPFVWGLASNGQAGVERVLDIFREELDTAMALLGLSSLTQISSDYIRRRDEDIFAR